MTQGVRQVAPGAPPGHRGRLMVRTTGGKLNEGDRYTLTIRYATELPPGGKRLPEDVATALDESFKVSKEAPGKL